MNRTTNGHLTEEMLNDVLIGMATSEAEAHLAGCTACRKQAEEFRADMALLGQAALGWSEARLEARAAGHLTEEALDDVLIGLATAESQAHLAACSACRAKVEGFQADVALLGAAAMGWSRQRAAGMDLQPLETRARQLHWAVLRWAAAGALIVAVALPFVWHHDNGPAVAANVTPRSPQLEENAAQIAADNDLMRAVDAAINPGDEMPMVAIHHGNKAHPRQKARPE